MFTWNVAEMKLMKSGRNVGRSMEFSEDYTTLQEDKIQFVDANTDGNLSYFLELFRKFQEDMEIMPKDQWGNVRTQSLIAWCKRNDPKKLIDREYKYGKIRFFQTERFIQNGVDHKGPWDTFDNLVDETFHRQLMKCRNEEIEYFKSHDEYEIAKSAVRDYADKYHTTFGMRLAFCSNGEISVVTDEDHFKGPQITLEQCQILIDLYKKLEFTIEDLTKECATQMSQI